MRALLAPMSGLAPGGGPRMAKKPAASTGKAATATSSAAGVAPRPALRAPSVVVRVRPLAESGGHSAEGKPVYKRLAKWDEGAIVLEDNVDDLGTGRTTGSSRPQVFTFAKEILGTDATQAPSAAVTPVPTPAAPEKDFAQGAPPSDSL